MNVPDLAKRAMKFAIDNSPTLLTTIGVVGTVTTAYLTGKASYEAAGMIALQEGTEGIPDDPREQLKKRVELVGKLYIAPAASCAATIACIIAANQVGTRRAAGLAAAFTITEKAFDEYKEKVVEKIGERKEEALRNEIAQDRVNRTSFKDAQVIVVSSSRQLCLDAHSGRYFESDIETLRSIENDIRDLVSNDNYASLTDYYNAIGLLPTKDSDEIGWKVGGRRFELEFSATISPDNRPCIVVDFGASPIRDYYLFP